MLLIVCFYITFYYSLYKEPCVHATNFKQTKLAHATNFKQIHLVHATNFKQTQLAHATNFKQIQTNANK